MRVSGEVFVTKRKRKTAIKAVVALWREKACVKKLL
jgi:hypothetical protein